MSILSKPIHTNLAALYRSGNGSDGNPYSVMELVDLVTMADRDELRGQTNPPLDH